MVIIKVSEVKTTMGLQPIWLTIIGIWLAVSGCASSGTPIPPQQVVAKVDSQTRQNRLQETLLRQVPQSSTADSKDYKIGPEDLLELNFMDTEKLKSEVRVNGDGEITPLLVGTVKVEGLTAKQVQEKLVQLYREGNYLKDPQIKVSVKEFRHKRVAVTGAVTKPEYYPLIGPRTLLEVLSMAGGLSDKAGEVVHVIRPRQGDKGVSRVAAATPAQPFSPGTETIVVDLNQLLIKGRTDLNPVIRNGDVVHVPFAQVAYVLGAVTKPGEVLVKNDMTVTKAIAQTGGLHIILSSNNATVLRLDENGQRMTIPVNVKQITNGTEPDLALKEGDIVYVQESGLRRFLFDIKMFNPGSVGMSVPAML
jgi:polysaccharide export outer membrane protein